MQAEVREKIYIVDPTPAMLEWCRIYLIVSNPDYEKKARMGLWTGNIPRQFQLYEKTDKYIAIPFGCLYKIHEAFPEMPMRSHIRPLKRVEYDSHINLYDYQENAAQAILVAKNGILVMPCGAGKTQTALETVARIGMKTLWLAHTQELMLQSMLRAKAVLGVDSSSYGMIADGKVNIGRGITFAMVQTMCKIDLTPYRDEWGCIVTDECLPGETLIDTSAGKKELKNLCIDDIITSYNVISDEIENKHVAHVFKNKAHDIVAVKLENGEKIVCTKNHPIFTRRGEWVAAERLTNDDYVLKKRAVLEWVRVESVEVQKQTSDGTFGGVCPDGYVYNIEVEDNNNYFANGILVHNCHHAVGGPTKAMQFYKVLSALSCRYKIGLTATPKRADGMERTMYALLGNVAHEVTKEEVAHTTCPVEVVRVETGYQPNVDVVLCGDGTISYANLVRDLTENKERFEVVSEVIEDCAKRGSVLVLASRVDYLQRLNDAFSGKSRCLSGARSSKAAKEERKSALKALNDGEIDCLFASYQLAREGLDIPSLRYVVFATPEKDPTTVVQSAGRVARRCEGKDHGTVVDLVDDFGLYRGWAVKRESIYVKKLGYKLK